MGTTFPQGTKFKKVNIKNHEAYIIINFEKNSDIAFISLTIPMGNHDIGLPTTSTKNKLDKDELMLINIATSFKKWGLRAMIQYFCIIAVKTRQLIELYQL